MTTPSSFAAGRCPSDGALRRVANRIGRRAHGARNPEVSGPAPRGRNDPVSRGASPRLENLEYRSHDYLATFLRRPPLRAGSGSTTTACDPAAAPPSSRSTRYCCAIVSTFMTVQYSTSPDGRL